MMTLHSLSEDVFLRLINLTKKKALAKTAERSEVEVGENYTVRSEKELVLFRLISV